MLLLHGNIKIMKTNYILITILITGSFITIIKILSNIKFKRLNISDNRKKINKNLFNNTFGRLYFLIRKIKIK